MDRADQIASDIQDAFNEGFGIAATDNYESIDASWANSEARNVAAVWPSIWRSENVVPTEADLLNEIRRLRVENARMRELVKTQRPELENLRTVVSCIRDLRDNLPQQIENMLKVAEPLLQGDHDLSRAAELSGSWGSGKARVDAAIDRSESK